MLRKKTNGVARRPQRTSILTEAANASVDRRAFLRGSGLAIGGLAAIAATGGSVAKLFAPLTSRLGWHSDFEIGTVLQEKGLVLEKRQKTPPLGMMTFLVLGKADQG